ncbi:MULTISPECIES: glycoside hydrolase family 15 protein [unclassified Achromobacter]|uniref:glycoside hydrolase family 15 protein n=1 Tax=unclassified Achromobacter TaxID=2626865 RepID=UPI000B51B9E8|nr:MULTISPECIES: glycoside hydrolase family 15 protein [unclassified Achromobacter]OWT75775.1 glucoamylase [Achromobacter sp. HZ28]OWT76435.1 glucoamylase [Achromobacter sp. HZ34]
MTRQTSSSRSKPLEDYGLIGNMLSAALVARDGSIDWLCLPHFNSPACFAALLGNESNGRWQLRPRAAECRTTRRYVPGTAVLETCHETATGKVTVFDFMPLSDDEHRVDVVRLIRGDEGHVEMDMELILRFNYGQAVPWVRRRDYGLSAVAGPDAVEIHTQVPMKGEDMKTTSRFTVHKGETPAFTLSYHPSHKSPHFVPDRGESLDRTIGWWREWSKRCRGDAEHHPIWHDAIVRSMITLKLLTFRPTGGMVAAPTTSLPERLGGERNWDYRYCWLRDSAMILYALLNGGYRDEAEAWRHWLMRATSGLPDQLQIMYGVSGERQLPEFELPWLPGYENSKPVRIGNAASTQIQMDIYGEVIEALHAAREAELAPLEHAWRLQRVLLQPLKKHWNTRDHGIWEVRGPRRAFTHSRVMCWVAFDRAIKSIERFNLDLQGSKEELVALRDKVHADICEHGFDPKLNSFVQSYGSKALDASLLMIPQVGFLPIDDPRVTGTVKAIEQRLLRDDGLVYRYDSTQTDDGLPDGEGVFLACSFWLADVYVMQGRMDDARALYNRLLGLRNDLGLLAEEYEPVSKRLIGNFPQGFSHIGIVNTGYNLMKATSGPAQQRASSSAPHNGDAPHQKPPKDVPHTDS